VNTNLIYQLLFFWKISVNYCMHS